SRRSGVGTSTLRLALLSRAEFDYLLPIRRHGRKSAIGRIHDQRRALCPHDLVAPVVPKLVVRDDAARRVHQTTNLWIDLITILASIFFLFKVRRFLVGKKLLRSQRDGSLHRGDGPKVPHSLQVRLAVRRSRRSPSLARHGYRRQQRNRDHDRRTI